MEQSTCKGSRLWALKLPLKIAGGVLPGGQGARVWVVIAARGHRTSLPRQPTFVFCICDLFFSYLIFLCFH